MAEHFNGEHRVFESSTGSADGSKIDMASKSPSRSKKYKKVSIFKKSAHDEGSSIKGSGRGKKKAGKDKKSEGVEVQDVMEQTTALPEIVPASPVHLKHNFSDSEVHHYEIQTQDHEEKSTGDLSVKQFQKLSKELAKQKKSVDALKRDRETLIHEKVKLKNENKVLKKTGSKSDLLRMSKRQSMEDVLFSTDEMKLRIKELEDQLAERDYKITALRLTIEKNSEHSLASDSIELDSEKPLSSGNKTTNGGILDSTAALEKLLEEQDISLKLRKENAELRACILAIDAEWDKSHKDSDPSPRSPRKRSSGFFKRGKKSTSSMPTRRVSEDSPYDSSRKRSPSPDLIKADTHHETDASVSPLLLRFNKESTSSLPCCGSPNQSPQMALKNKTSSDSGTLQACLKMALSEKNAFEESNASLQKELDSTREKLKELEKDLETKIKEAVWKLQRSQEATEIDRDTYRDELKISQQEVDDMLEKQRSMEKAHAEALKAKDNRIKELEEKLECFKRTHRSPSYGSSSVTSSPKKSAAFESSREGVFSPTRVTKETSSPTTKTITSPTRAKDIPSPTRFASTSSSRTVTSPTRPVNAASPTRFTKDVTSPTRPNRSQSPTKAISEPKTADSTQVSDPKQSSKVRKLSKDLSTEKSPGLPPTSSSTRKVGKLLRESSIDKFETPKESAPKESAPKESAPKEQATITKRKNSGQGMPPPSTSHSFAKVAATRAMFEQKIDQTKTSYSQIRRPLKSASDSEEKRRFSVSGGSSTTSENKSVINVMHSKSNSYDLSKSSSITAKSPSTPIEKVPEVVLDTVDSKPKPVPPTSDKDRTNGPSSVTNDDRSRSDTTHRQQQEKRFSVTNSVAVVTGNSSVSNKATESVFAASTTRVTSPTKVSKITITSTASPTTSPLPANRRDMATKASQGLGLLVRNPTSPSLGTTGRTPSPTSPSNTKVLLCSQQSSPARMGGNVRRLSSTKEAELSKASSESNSGPPPTVSRSQTNKKVQHSVGSWSKPDKVSSSMSVSSTRSSSSTNTPSNFTTKPTTITSSSTKPTTITSSSTTTKPTTITSSSTSNHSVNSSVLSPTSTSTKSTSQFSTESKLTSPVAKMGSLQNIPSYVNGSEESGSTSLPQSSTASVSSSSTVVMPSSGARRGPTHRAAQRRERKDRPKTMYAGRAETTNLVNLISKFQLEEKDKKFQKELNSGSTANSHSALAPASKPAVNGGITSLSSSTVVTSTVSNVTLRQHSPSNIHRPRPATFYIGESNKSSTSSGKSENLGLSGSFSGGISKPPPHERRLMRSQTTYGMGNNRMSKKAMLLRWCQMITQNYENVNISNFAESFSNGLAFCALVHHFIPDQVPFSTLSPTTRERNFKIAFQAAEGVGIPSLLDVEDMVSLPIPDWMSVMTYVSFIYNKFGQESQQQQNQSSMV